ncbi:polysaccharide deacetylase family protein [Anoxynatronum buryatiense]|uniref:Peptidoglycan/xylan/chitin deacetylase, PgdA/CDA1 family n=1 Tax=Anoxynatronum buryatiense TaxID=489973 RepID=A0AA46AHB9_9CLOT|nr:polysaccharide deacetylase family protein [Anoxynatronum buryatiense]SMP38091.1 Peptidoglycan/xylan/chitin deacetylase, PgdA/CDA1 family [Anoxynatronum buryatiense]
MVSGNRNDERTVYLTFDDGPSANTARILDLLKQHQIPATFFVVGSDSEFAQRMYHRIVDEGHALGNHTYTHDYQQIYSSVDGFMNDVLRLQDHLETITGVRPEVFRFPAGSNNRFYQQFQSSDNPFFMIEIMQALENKGLAYFDWNVSSTDAAASTLDTDIIISNTLNNLAGHQNAIILFHDSSPKTTTVEALPQIIAHLKSRGYTFKKLTSDSFYVKFHHLGMNDSIE